MHSSNPFARPVFGVIVVFVSLVFVIAIAVSNVISYQAGWDASHCHFELRLRSMNASLKSADQGRPSESPESPTIEPVRSEVAPTTPDTHADCAAMRKILEDRISALEVDNAAMRGVIAHDRLWRAYPESTPYGAFLRSPEASQMPELVQARVRDWLNEFPVVLRPGEAQWLADRTLAGDWHNFAPTSTQAVIEFLGPARLIAELPFERLSYLKADEDVGWLFR